jgi:hypothetical protein
MAGMFRCRYTDGKSLPSVRAPEPGRRDAGAIWRLNRVMAFTRAD